MKKHLLVALAGTITMGLAAAGCGSQPPTCCAPPPVVIIPPVVIPPPPVTPPTLAVTRVMTFGDSLTEGESTPLFWGLHNPGTPGAAVSYPFKLWSILTTTYTAQTIEVFNLGLGGEAVTNSTAKARFIAALRTYTPHALILMEGTNDLIQLVDRGVIVGAIEELISEARSRGVYVYLSSVPRQLPNPAKGTVPARVPTYNADLERMAGEEPNVTFVDIYPHITDAMMAPDGLHLTQAGNQKLAEIYYDAVKARYHVPAPAAIAAYR